MHPTRFTQEPPRHARPFRNITERGFEPPAWKAWLIVAVALILGLAITSVAVVGARRALDAQARSDFERRADTIESEIGRRLGVLGSVLKGSYAAYQVAGRMDDEDLRRYVRSPTWSWSTTSTRACRATWWATTCGCGRS